MNLKGSRTEKNLLAAFAGESQARNRYTYFASTARKEGYEQIASLFQETADNEKEHAKRFFGFLTGGEVEIIASYPAGSLGTTAQNLEAAAAGENMEWTTLYPQAAQIARDEGFPDIASAFARIADVERRHEARYRRLLANIAGGRVFRRDSGVSWKCRNCGYIHEGNEAPRTCPACAHPQSFFELFCEPY